jgi:hypothetical protein
VFFFWLLLLRINCDLVQRGQANQAEQVLQYAIAWQ